MPHAKHRKLATRRRILEAAARLFETRGFDATTIDHVMGACGLTRGGFYLHFRSKAQLHEEATALRREASANDPWARLALEAGSSVDEVRQGYALTLKAVLERLAQGLVPGAAPQHLPLALAAMAIGEQAVSHSVDDPVLRQQMAHACHQACEALTGRIASEQVFFWAVDSHMSHPAHHATH